MTRVDVFPTVAAVDATMMVSDWREKSARACDKGSSGILKVIWRSGSVASAVDANPKAAANADNAERILCITRIPHCKEFAVSTWMTTESVESAPPIRVYRELFSSRLSEDSILALDIAAARV